MVRNKIIELTRQLEPLNSSIKISWIPAHKGIIGNEHADRLAKAATDLSPETNFPLPYTKVANQQKTKLKNDYFLRLPQDAIDLNKGVFYFENFYSRSLSPWFKSLIKPREFIVLFNRIRSNHYNLNFSLC